MDQLSIIKKNFQESVDLKKSLMEDEKLMSSIDNLASDIARRYEDDKKVLFCGNGGSAADAQHLAAELSGRYYFDRPPLFSEALHVNTSYITAVANDYSYDEIYSRLIRAMGRDGDTLIGLSTSGNSINVINAMIEGKKQGMQIVGMTGQGGGNMKDYCDIWFEIPSKNTPRIQECHMLIGHTLCELVESKLFG